MLHVEKFHDLGELNARLRDAGAASTTLTNDGSPAAGATRRSARPKRPPGSPN